MVAIGAILLIAYYRTIRDALRPSEFLSAHESAVKKFAEFSGIKQLTSIKAEFRNDQLQLFSEQQLTELSSSLSFALILNQAVYLWAYQLDKYRRSSFPLLFSMGSYVVLFVATVLSLGALNLGLLHLDATSFTYVEVPSTMRILHHSMASLYLNGAPGMEPASDVAVVVSLLGGFVGVVLLGTVIANLVYSATNRDDQALRETIERVKDEGERLEGRLIEEYQVTSYEDALGRLERLGNGLVGVITFLARQVPEDLHRREK
jgi:hypothetical protein